MAQNLQRVIYGWLEFNQYGTNGSSFDGLCLRCCPCPKRSIAPNHKFILGRLCLRQPPQGFNKRLWIKPLQGCYPYLNLATDSSRSGLLLEEAESRVSTSHYYRILCDIFKKKLGMAQKLQRINPLNNFLHHLWKQPLECICQHKNRLHYNLSIPLLVPQGLHHLHNLR